MAYCGAGAVTWQAYDFMDILFLMRAHHGRRPGRGERALQEHRWIADAISAGSADIASLLIGQHIRASRDDLLAAIRTQSFDGQEN